VFGGPAYFIRNILYNVPNGCALKFMSKPAGLYVFHNTIIAENGNRETYSNAHFRNNLFLGIDAAKRAVAVFPMATSYSTYDYDGYRPNKNGADQFVWVAPVGKLRDYDITAKDAKSFSSLKEFSAATGLEAHGIEVDYDVFVHLVPPDPLTPHAVYHAADLDFRIKPNGKAVDKGIVLPNVNDGFKGKAPDLGAIEAGTPVPIYGRRVPDKSSFYR
jgi:hypothetical protein